MSSGQLARLQQDSVFEEKPEHVLARKQELEYIMKTCDEGMEKVFDEKSGKTNCKKKCKKGTIRKNKYKGRTTGKCNKVTFTSLFSYDFNVAGNFIVEEVEGKFYKCTRDPTDTGLPEIIYLPVTERGIYEYRR